jgi:hypothetical protein
MISPARVRSDHYFLHLDGGRAEVMPVDDQFWPTVMSGQRPLP